MLSISLFRKKGNCVDCSREGQESYHRYQFANEGVLSSYQNDSEAPSVSSTKDFFWPNADTECNVVLQNGRIFFERDQTIPYNIENEEAYFKHCAGITFHTLCDQNFDEVAEFSQSQENSLYRMTHSELGAPQQLLTPGMRLFKSIAVIDGVRSTSESVAMDITFVTHGC